MSNSRDRLSNLRGDVFGGLTAAVVALPLALAFGVASGAGALAGLYGAIVIGFFAAFLGGTPSQVSGPTGPMTVVMAGIILQFGDQPALAFTVVMMGGLIQIAFGFFKLGSYINLVPYSVTSGFMSGIGGIIILLQLAPLTGHESPAGAMLGKIAALPALLGNPQADALILGLLTLTIVCLTPAKIGRLVPSALIALVIGTMAGVFFLKEAPTIGDIPKGWPSLQMPMFSLDVFPLMLRSALVLAFLGSVDSLLTSLIADSVTRTHHDSNRELIGQGAGNIMSGFIGGIPGAGATMRTVANVRAGGRTRLSGMLHAVVLLFIVLFFSDLAENIPLSVLAGILLKVGVDIIDWRYLKIAIRTLRPGAVIMLTTLILTVTVDLMVAVATGMVMASLLFLKRTSDAQMSNVKRVAHPDQSEGYSDEELAILERSDGRVMVFQIEGAMGFGSAKAISRLLASSNESDILIVDFLMVSFIDSSAALALEEAIQNVQQDQGKIIFCQLREEVLKTLQQLGTVKQLESDCVLPDRVSALRRAEELLAVDAKKE